jgi:hypothetical protein
VDLSNEAALVIPLSLPRARPEPGSTAASEPAPADLVTAARRGDRSAFAELYRQHVRMVHGLLLARAGAQADRLLARNIGQLER